jgi:hypothetical protein
VEEEAKINKVATTFYRDIFGPSSISHINMNNFNMVQLNDIDRSFLTSPFTNDEDTNVVDTLNHNSAPGPDGLPIDFFQTFREVIKNMLALFLDFHKGALPIKRLNYGVITLLPKTKNANEIKKVRPVCLLSVYYTIITKALNNRLASCIKKLISESQSGFIKGRSILDSVVVLHDTSA